MPTDADPPSATSSSDDAPPGPSSTVEMVWICSRCARRIGVDGVGLRQREAGERCPLCPEPDSEMELVLTSDVTRSGDSSSGPTEQVAAATPAPGSRPPAAGDLVVLGDRSVFKVGVVLGSSRTPGKTRVKSFSTSARSWSNPLALRDDLVQPLPAPEARTARQRTVIRAAVLSSAAERHALRRRQVPSPSSTARMKRRGEKT